MFGWCRPWMNDKANKYESLLWRINGFCSGVVAREKIGSIIKKVELSYKRERYPYLKFVMLKMNQSSVNLGSEYDVIDHFQLSQVQHPMRSASSNCDP